MLSLLHSSPFLITSYFLICWFQNSKINPVMANFCTFIAFLVWLIKWNHLLEKSSAKTLKSVKKFSKKQSSELVPVKSKKRPFSMTSIRTMKASIICWLGPLEWLEFRQMNSLKQKIESSVVVDIFTDK